MSATHSTGRSKVIRIRANQLRVHPTAQRPASPVRVKYLIANMDAEAIGVIHAVEATINGIQGFWIIDGQHRWHSLIDSGRGNTEVEVKIHLDLDAEDASRLFLRLNNRLSVPPLERYKNEFYAGEPAATGVEDVLDRFSLSALAGGAIKCTEALKSIWNLDQGATLSRALDVVDNAWGKKKDGALEGEMLKGLSRVIFKNNGGVDEESLVRKLSKVTPAALIGNARSYRDLDKGGSLFRLLAKGIAKEYNRGRSARQIPTEY